MIAAQRETLGSSGAADWLSLAAAPTFAVMALLTAVSGGSDMICSTASHTSPLTGMIPMYFLMSAFHLSPWLKLISSRRACRPDPALAQQHTDEPDNNHGESSHFARAVAEGAP
ncbi:hypothetical protein AM571_CH00795 [Rhizobium etli 8C-3]|uniref:Uncharacterized protein n=2 Tax=Rhizobium TaxID=379 RepID=A0A4R3RZ72_9HYPH|nr:hypothetical protein AM571_CH00795 [Rhizobium etli 8C-3]TCU28016.1 hypothetical protein EV130_103422 [Rhizobium azibense]TCU37186.1 hypothetical protein EV129_106148 [Rhizobium azibense]